MPDETNKAAPKGEPKADEQAKASPAPSKPTRTPLEWAELLGFVNRVNPTIEAAIKAAGEPGAHAPQLERTFHWKHAAADRLYGWSEHAYHFQADEDRFLITEEDYRKALDAAADYPCSAPHAPALPESQTERFAGFVPAARS
jgi:hypothetical protein